MMATDDSTIENPSIDEEQVSSENEAKTKRPRLIDFLKKWDKRINNARQNPEPAQVNLKELISAAKDFALGLEPNPNPKPVKRIKKINTSPPCPYNLELRIGPPVDDRHVDPPHHHHRPELFPIQKVLHTSDIDGSSRFLLPKVQAEAHFLPHIDIHGGDGVEIGVLDLDTNTEHMLVLKWWKSSRGYVLTRNWVPDFARRRRLMIGDKVGFRWDPRSSRLEFALLERHN